MFNPICLRSNHHLSSLKVCFCWWNLHFCWWKSMYIPGQVEVLTQINAFLGPLGRFSPGSGQNWCLTFVDHVYHKLAIVLQYSGKIGDQPGNSVTHQPALDDEDFFQGGSGWKPAGRKKFGCCCCCSCCCCCCGRRRRSCYCFCLANLGKVYWNPYSINSLESRILSYTSMLANQIHLSFAIRGWERTTLKHRGFSPGSCCRSSVSSSGVCSLAHRLALCLAMQIRILWGFFLKMLFLIFWSEDAWLGIFGYEQIIWK